ncbi:hypothetical protein BKA62DRAFT_772231 [Auriculariales sp. MPI-PUGE-AT-0066]|nr:hypothetical protein BKA62DRAFT_772231 [Auriculariales sp. MPI-PUGE-AT-0066]
MSGEDQGFRLHPINPRTPKRSAPYPNRRVVSDPGSPTKSRGGIGPIRSTPSAPSSPRKVRTQLEIMSIPKFKMRQPQPDAPFIYEPGELRPAAAAAGSPADCPKSIKDLNGHVYRKGALEDTPLQESFMCRSQRKAARGINLQCDWCFTDRQDRNAHEASHERCERNRKEHTAYGADLRVIEICRVCEAQLPHDGNSTRHYRALHPGSEKAKGNPKLEEDHYFGYCTPEYPY